MVRFIFEVVAVGAAFWAGGHYEAKAFAYAIRSEYEGRRIATIISNSVATEFARIKKFL